MINHPSAESSDDRTPAPMVSVVLCTYNRCELLPAAIRSLTAQTACDIPFELIIVDNNSSDRTPEVVETAIREALCDIRYVFESCQGLSSARNAGIGAARAPIVAFTDDDVTAAPDWLKVLCDTFADPWISCAGGKVLPQWPPRRPAWLTKIHWSPLALVDRGDLPLISSLAAPLIFVGANLAVRASVFGVVGRFETDFQRVKDGIGSTEDHEFLMRMYRAGFKGLYVPTLIVHAPVQDERLTKNYHRRWYKGHGHFIARMGLIEPDRVSPNLFGVPSYYYRGMIAEAVAWLKATLRSEETMAFHHELEIRRSIQFLKTSRKHYEHGTARLLPELRRFLTSLARKKWARSRSGRQS